MKLQFLISLFIISFASTAATAADIEAGKKRAAVCIGCHGPDGISFIPTYPNLKGQKAAYTEKQLRDFKAKKRIDPTMIAQSMSLSDADIKNIAAYYESLGKK
ncbi:c-type cytochrome [Aliikangiella coralliicola]|uniref:Cytochrome c n=1 Tax=Aliikangiella coralliicola TaxID=2592383 RepID=A0A545UGF2_9GAMM|nr:cytochrome c [Aliikangiella coralliicola]TQV88550.1 cytochrome c [Aliikangiella coralliicola]